MRVHGVVARLASSFELRGEVQTASREKVFKYGQSLITSAPPSEELLGQSWVIPEGKFPPKH